MISVDEFKRPDSEGSVMSESLMDWDFFTFQQGRAARPYSGVSARILGWGTKHTMTREGNRGKILDVYLAGMLVITKNPQ